jgi:dTDP-4-amino-4,6-dideoxygalactose transaminase
METRAPHIATQDVPFVDLRPGSAELNEAILTDIAALLESMTFHYGAQLHEFEAAFADYCTARYCVGMSSGVDALRLALLAAGIEQGDEVIVPANTFIATFEAIHQAGGRPVPVDASDEDYNIDSALIQLALSGRTRFIVPVHLYGQMADMRPIIELARQFGLEVIEDACQAHGAERDDLRSGAVGRAGAFSFYPSKNLGAAGDAGAVVTDDAELAEKMRALRHHGETRTYHSEFEGYTARLDTIQAIVLLHKLPHLDSWNEQRRSASAYYSEALDGIGDLRLPPVAARSKPVWHLYVVRTADPVALEAYLAEREIGTKRHYPEPPHLSGAYAWLGHGRGDFPRTEALADEALSLPIFPGISEAQLDAVAAAVADYFA